MTSPAARRLAWVATIAYLLVAGLWIVASDRLLLLLVEPAGLARWQTAKGLAFVGFTALALYVLLRRAGSHAEAEAEPALTPSARGPWLRVGLAAYVIVLVVAGLTAWVGLRDEVEAAHARELEAAGVLHSRRVEDWFDRRAALVHALVLDPTLDAAGLAEWQRGPPAREAGAAAAWLIAAGGALPAGAPPEAAAALAAVAEGGAPRAWVAGGEAGRPRFQLAHARVAGGDGAVVIVEFAVTPDLERLLREPLPRAAGSSAALSWTAGADSVTLAPAPSGGLDLRRTPNAGAAVPAALPRPEEGESRTVHDPGGRPALGVAFGVHGTPFTLQVIDAAAGLDAGQRALAGWFAATFLVLLAAAGVFARNWWRVQEVQRRATEARLDHLARFARDGVVLLDAGQRIVDQNDAVGALIGRTLDHTRGRSVAELCGPATAAALPQLWARATSAEGLTVEAEVVHADGHLLPVEVSARPVRIRDRDYVQVLVRDITERRSAQARIEHLTRLYATLSRSNEAVVRATSAQDLLETCCRVATAETGYLLAWIGVPEADSGDLRPVAQSGPAAVWLAGARVSTRADRPEGRGPAGRAYRELAPQVANDFLADPTTAPWHAEAAAAGAQASASLPIADAAGRMGVLSVYAAAPGAFDTEAVALLAEMANDIGYGLRRFELDAERARAQAALAASELRLRLALSAAHQGLFDYDLATGTVVVNDGYARMLGHDPADFHESHDAWRARLHPDDRERAAAWLDDYLAGRHPEYRSEFRLRTASGDWCWILSVGAVTERDPAGRPLRMLGTHVDITERKLAEEDLRASEARFRELFEANPHPMWVYDLGTLAFLAVNDAAIAHYGYTREEFLAMTIADIRPPEDVPALLRNVRQVGSGTDQAGQWRHRRRDGSVIEVEISSHTLRYGERPAEVVLASDVTERNAARRALETEERKFRTLAEQSLVGIYMIDAERVVYFNPRAAEIFGYAADEAAGAPLRALVADEDWPVVRANVARRLSGEIGTLQYEFRGRRKDGGTVMIGVHGSVTEVDGRGVVMGVLQDITAKLAAERQLLEHVGRMERAVLGTVDAVSQMVELRDPYTAGHERRVGALAAAIAAEMGLDGDAQRGLRIAGGVHDVGKITVPAEILVKPTRLTAIEFELVKNHAAQGYEILKNVEFPWPVAEVARQHHERMDGSGYPRGLQGEAILLEARIIAVADVVESMASHRPYRPTLGIDAALAEIEGNRGRWYDPAAADACLRLFRERGYTLEPR